MRAPVLIALCAVGCAHAPAADELSDVKHRLDEAQRRQTAAEQKVQELEDRVFLLTDQLESQKVASARRGEPPRLPVVTLRPEASPAPVNEDGEEIEYQGDARSATPERVRPVLRVDGGGSSSSSSPAPASARPRKSSPTFASSAPLPSASLPSPSPPRSDVRGDPAGENLGVAPAPTVPSAIKGEHPAPDADPLKLYRAAYDDLRAGRHDDAVRGFREFVRRYPRHDYADNAQYWLGEAFYDRKLYVDAATEFRAVVTRWPTGNKAPDALLKLGYCMLAVGETRAARELLAQVPSTYPKTEAARLASERLAELKLKEEPK
jgi:tol-pal system protein YbgF